MSLPSRPGGSQLPGLGGRKRKTGSDGGGPQPQPGQRRVTAPEGREENQREDDLGLTSLSLGLAVLPAKSASLLRLRHSSGIEGLWGHCGPGSRGSVNSLSGADLSMEAGAEPRLPDGSIGAHYLVT